jgi:hypothetical protein
MRCCLRLLKIVSGLMLREFMQDGHGLLHQNRGFLAMPRIYDLDRMGVLLPALSLDRAGWNRAAGKRLIPRNRLG